MTDKILCIIPARGGSKRIPRKNIVDLCGRPLISYTIEAAKNSKLFEKVVVSTEDGEIAKVSEKYGATVLERKLGLASDNASVMDVSLDVIEQYGKKGENFDYVCILLTTSPLRKAEDITGAFNKLKQSDANAVMAVTTYAIPPFLALKEENGFLKLFFGEKYMLRSQELPKVCVDNGSVYIFRTDAIKKEKKFYCSKLIGYKMPRERSIDVDEEVDLKIAEYFIKEGEK